MAEANGLDAWENIRLLQQISHREVLSLMGEALLYIGNSMSEVDAEYPAGSNHYASLSHSI